MSLLAGAALAAVAGAAGAQTPYGYPAYPPVPAYPTVPAYPGYGGYGGYGNQTATLYELPGFQGRSVVVNGSNGNLDNIGFNDRTRSVRLSGTWRLCEDADFRSRCETMSGSIPDLSRRGISGLSSLQPVDSGYPDGGYGGGAVQGRSVVFYPGPVSSTYGRPPWGYGGGNAYGYGTGRRAADDFCRSMGNREAVYYDNAAGTLQDVLCRR
ncbi:MAG: beta/gamma crystallin-related protein [Parcubacteria group bacterium]